MDARGRSRGLRGLPFLKAPLIAAVWAVTTTGLSAVPVTEALRTTALELAGLQFTFFLAFAIAFDGMDLPHDPKTLRTVPQWLGARGSRWSAALLMLPWVVCLIAVQYAEGRVSPAWLMPGLGYLLAMSVLALSGAQRPLWYGQFVMDGLLLFIPLLAAVGLLWG